MKRFYIAPKNYGIENVEDGFIAWGENEADALERHIETHMADYDYATDLDMLIRAVQGGPISRFDVTIRTIPCARAKQVTE